MHIFTKVVIIDESRFILCSDTGTQMCREKRQGTPTGLQYSQSPIPWRWCHNLKCTVFWIIHCLNICNKNARFHIYRRRFS